MLQILHNSNGPNGSTQQISGPSLKKMLWGKSPAERAKIVAELSRLNPTFTDLSATQLSHLCDADGSAVSRARGRAGTRGPRAKTLDRLVKKYGPDGLRRAIDRAAQPELPLHGLETRP